MLSVMRFHKNPVDVCWPGNNAGAQALYLALRPLCPSRSAAIPLRCECASHTLRLRGFGRSRTNVKRALVTAAGGLGKVCDWPAYVRARDAESNENSKAWTPWRPSLARNSRHQFALCSVIVEDVQQRAHHTVAYPQDRSVGVI